MKARPVFVMSSERSGSNLLRRLLSNHTRITGAIAPHFLKIFAPNESAYLALDDGRQELFSDMLSVANHRKHRWGIEMEYPEFTSRYKSEKFLDFFDGFYSQLQSRDGSAFVVCKENQLFDYADELASYYSQACLFVYLHRDPRDYAWSWMGVPLMFDDPFKAADNWVIEQQKCLDFMARCEAPAVRVSYEELVDDVEQPVTRILSALGLDPEDGCFDPRSHQSPAEDTDFVYTRNLDQPVSRDNMGKSLRGFDSNTLYFIEEIAAAEMQALGYSPRFRHSVPKTLAKRWLSRIRREDPSRYKASDHDEYSTSLLADWTQLQARLQNKFR